MRVRSTCRTWSTSTRTRPRWRSLQPRLHGRVEQVPSRAGHPVPTRSRWIHRTSWCGGRRALRRGLRARSRCGWWLNLDHLHLRCWQQPFDGSSSWEEQGEDGTGFELRVESDGIAGRQCPLLALLEPCPLGCAHGTDAVGSLAPAERRSTRSGVPQGWRAASPDSAKRTGTQGPAAASPSSKEPVVRSTSVPRPSARARRRHAIPNSVCVVWGRGGAEHQGLCDVE